MEKTIRKALQEAGKILMNNFGRISDYEIKESQSSIVTKADIESEKRIIEIISKNSPTIIHWEKKLVFSIEIQS